MIKIFGIDVYYILRTTGAVDELLTEAPNSSFTHAIPIEMYVNSYDGFSGQGDLLSKFGLNVADKLTLSVARRRFQDDIANDFALIRPREGDLVYFPLSNGLFEIKFVEHEAAFYQTGALQYFELELEKFNYNSELFNTGIEQIDAVYKTQSSLDDTDYLYLSQDSNSDVITQDGLDLTQQGAPPINIDQAQQNKEFQTVANTFIDFSIEDPFSESGKY